MRDPRAEVGATSRHTKLFVLDTNVLMHDPTCLFRFAEHDVYVAMAVLEELDTHKKGMSEVARNARQASRFIEEIVSHDGADITRGVALRAHGGFSAEGRLFLQTHPIAADLPFWTASPITRFSR
jgi:PhoH-like ATPase